MARGCKCFHINFLDNLLLTSGILLFVNCVDFKLKNQPDILPKSNSYITFAHPIFLEIIFEFQKNVKNPNENFAIHAHGLMFYLEMIMTHISYGQHFMNLKFVFYLMVALKIRIKALPLNKTNKNHPNDNNLVANQTFAYFFITLSSSAAWLSTNLTLQFMILLHLEGQPNILCKPILYFTFSEDDPCCHSPASLSSNLPRLLCQLSACHHNLRLYFMNQNMLYIIKLISPLGYLVRYYFNMKFSQVETNLRKICCSIQVYDQVQRKHFHASAKEESLVSVFAERFFRLVLKWAMVRHCQSADYSLQLYSRLVSSCVKLLPCVFFLTVCCDGLVGSFLRFNCSTADGIYVPQLVCHPGPALGLAKQDTKVGACDFCWKMYCVHLRCTTVMGQATLIARSLFHWPFLVCVHSNNWPLRYRANKTLAPLQSCYITCSSYFLLQSSVAQCNNAFFGVRPTIVHCESFLFFSIFFHFHNILYFLNQIQYYQPTLSQELHMMLVMNLGNFHFLSAHMWSKGVLYPSPITHILTSSYIIQPKNNHADTISCVNHSNNGAISFRKPDVSVELICFFSWLLSLLPFYTPFTYMLEPLSALTAYKLIPFSLLCWNLQIDINGHLMLGVASEGAESFSLLVKRLRAPLTFAEAPEWSKYFPSLTSNNLTPCLKIIPQLGKPLAIPRGGQKIITPWLVVVLGGGGAIMLCFTSDQISLFCVFNLYHSCKLTLFICGVFFFLSSLSGLIKMKNPIYSVFSELKIFSQLLFALFSFYSDYLFKLFTSKANHWFFTSFYTKSVQKINTRKCHNCYTSGQP
ncbi:hypothetical protein VP01_1823g1 [Puccinia sorghi]|uniref:Uncharacterized protein n=1 Tax=Puccinia sorghi TaxID=27349 RepID=A0A0L6VEJ7_9BASI|nr:hypothetical protein VP01_1823g1 [Puccinia sorghi]